MAAAALIVVLIALGFGFAPMLHELVSHWRDPYGSMSHGVLVAVLALFFGWRAWRAQPPGLMPKAGRWWLLPLVFLVVLGTASELLYLGSSRMALLPLILFATLATLFGYTQSRRLLIPAFFLYLGLPVWGILNPLLQAITTAVSTRVILLSGIPVHVEGNFVHLVDGVFEIASGCAGLNYFLAALTLGVTFAIVNISDTRNRLRVILVFALAGIFSNWLRVVMLIMIGHWTHMQHYLIRVDHLWFGWALFLLMLGPLMLWARRYTGDEPSGSTQAPGGLPARSPQVGWRARDLGIASITAVVLALPAAIVPEQEDGLAPQPVAVRFESGWRPVFAGAQIEQHSDGGVDQVIATYDKPARDARISLPENDVGGEGWQQASQVRHSDFATHAVMEVRGYVDGRERLIWFWYDVGGRRALTKPGYRWAELITAIHGSRVASIVAYGTDCRGNCSSARALLAARVGSSVTKSQQ